MDHRTTILKMIEGLTGLEPYGEIKGRYYTDMDAFRIIRALLKFAPNANTICLDLWDKVVGTLGQGQTIDDVARAVREDGKVRSIIAEWAGKWHEVLFLTVLTTSGTPAPSTESRTGRPQEALRNQVFTRDGIFCLVTNRPDLKFRPRPLGLNAGETRFDDLTLAHIIPLSVSNKASARTMISYFTNSEVVDQVIRGSAINNLGNLLLLAPEAHKAFDRFDWSIKVELDQMGQATYRFYWITEDTERLSMVQRVTGRNSGETPPNGMVMLFGQQNSGYELPSPALCNLHFNLANVLHASGAAAAYEKILREEEQLQCNALDKQNLGIISRKLVAYSASRDSPSTSNSSSSSAPETPSDQEIYQLECTSIRPWPIVVKGRDC